MIPSAPMLAGRFERVLANLVDTFLLLVPGGIIATAVGQSEVAIPLMFLCNLAYYTAFEGSPWQASPGKRLFNIYVLRLNGRPLDQTRALERYLAFVIPSLPIYLSFLSEQLASALVVWLSLLWFLPILFRDDRAGLHDRICSTRIVVGRVG